MMEIKIPFNTWSRKKLREHKICTSRSKVYGEAGDWFQVNHVKYRIDAIIKLPIEIIIRHLFFPEGAENPEELRRVLKGIFRGNKLPEYLYTHFFTIM